MPAVDPNRTHQTASKLAQVLAETIIRAHPITAEIGEQTKRRIADNWLEGLERHSTGIVGGLIDQMIEEGNVDDEVLTLLKAAKDPTAQFGSIVQQFFIYGLMFTLAQSLLAPFVQQVQNDIWKANPDRPISPPDVATAVIRGIELGSAATTENPGWATDEMAKSGVPAANAQLLTDITGEPPALQLLFEMIRRQIIDEATLRKGIREGDTRDEWIETVAKLRYIQPSPVDFVQAAVRNEIDYNVAKGWATTVGLEPAGYLENNPDWFDLLYHTAGRPPGPVEMGHAALRGIVPWDGTGPDSISFHQAIAESDVKDKYWTVLQQLAVYFPPPGEVRTLLLHGGITSDQAIALWKKGGIPQELATAYAYVTETQQITQDRALAKGDIVTLVTERLITDDEATTYLKRIGYTDGNAKEIVALGHARYELDALRAAVRRVEQLYTQFKITAVQAKEALSSLGLADDNVASLMATLEVQRESESAIPTASQISSALYYKVITQDTAMAYLKELGYDDYSAWLVLSVRLHGPLPNAPTRSGPLN